MYSKNYLIKIFIFRFADQMDRDYELWEANSHPYQLFFYSYYNKLRIEEVENAALRKEEKEPIKDQILRLTEEKVQREEQQTGREVDKMRKVGLKFL